MEVITGELSYEQVEEELRFVAKFLAERDVAVVQVKHWFGEVSVPPLHLVDAFAEGFQDQTNPVPATSQRRIRLGDADFTIFADTLGVGFSFDHEDYVGVSTCDSQVADRFHHRWLSLSYAPRTPQR